MEAGMRKVKKITVNLDKNLDPTFGDLQPDAVEAFLVMVTPAVTDIKRFDDWFFLALMPETGEQGETERLLASVLDDFLDEGDRYVVRNFTHQDYESFDGNMPVLGFHPERMDEFFWLRPPQHLMH